MEPCLGSLIYFRIVVKITFTFTFTFTQSTKSDIPAAWTPFVHYLAFIYTKQNTKDYGCLVVH